jgi:hypothetical protein
VTTALDFLNAPDKPQQPQQGGGAPETPSPEPSGPMTAEQFLESPDTPPQPAAPQEKEQFDNTVGFFDRAALSAHDSINEKEMYLKKRGYEVTRKGGLSDLVTGGKGEEKLFIKKNGQEVEVPKDMGFFASMVGDSPEIVGSIEGAGIGAGAGTAVLPGVGTVVGGIIGSGVGALAGYHAKQAAKSAYGTYNKTTDEEIHGDIGAFGEGALGEAGGQVIGKVAKKVLAGHIIPRFMSGATDESIEKTEKAWMGGARPPYVSVAPDSRKLARIEIDAEKLTGKYAEQDKRNQQYVLSEVRNTLAEQGVPKPQLDGMMKMLQDPNAPAFSGRDAGELLQRSIQAQAEVLEHHVGQAAAASDKLIDTRLANIDRMIDAHPAGMLADDTADMIKNAKQQFSQAATDVYERIHASLGGARVVPTATIRAAAKQITSLLPKSAIPGIVKEMSQVADRSMTPEDAVLLKEFGIAIDDDKISLRDAQRMRTVLSERGGATDLTRNTVKGDHLAVARAVDNAIQEAGQDPQAMHAIKALNQADAWYRQNIAKFKDTAVKNIVKQTKSGMPPDPQKIVNILASPGQSARTTTLRQVLGEGVWKRVQSIHMGTVMQAATKPGERGGNVVNGMDLLEYLAKPENLSVFKAVHGDAEAADLKEIGQMLAARKGTLSPEALMQGPVRSSLEILKRSEERLDDYLNKNLLAEMRDPKKTGEDVFRWVVEPGKETRILEVARQFGQNSPQMAEIRQAGLEMLARNATLHSIEKEGTGAIDYALNQFTDTQRKLLFPNGMYEDLKALSETIKFIYPHKPDVGMAGMHAGAILEKPLLGGKQGFWAGRLAKQMIAATMRFVILRPAIARTLVTGRKQDTMWIVRAAAALKQIAKADIINNGLSDQPEVQNSNPQMSVDIHHAQERQQQGAENGDGGSGQDDQPAQRNAGGKRGKAGPKAQNNGQAPQGTGAQVPPH